jgi:hypothetical protein
VLRQVRTHASSALLYIIYMQLLLESYTYVAVSRTATVYHYTMNRDPATGREYDFCGRTHARQALAVRHTIRKCSTPHCSNDAWIDAQTGRSLLHCSSQHAGWAGLPVGASRCSLPGCTLSQFCHPDTREELSFCGEKHRLLAVARGLAAVTEPGVERVFR